MYLLSANDLFSGKTVQALCWMLVHSLWIGLLLTVITGVIMICTKKQSSLLRYNLLTGTFLAFTVIMAIVFVQAISSFGDPAQPAGTATDSDTKNIVSHTQALEPSIAAPGFTASITDFFNRYAGIIVMAWFLIIAFRCIKLAGGLYRLHQLKHDQLSSPGDDWSNRLAVLSSRLNIKRPVRFFQSGITKIPMVVGHFKPVILFPIGVLTSLPEDEIEAILVHELAHIRRKDYLVNMIQHFVEILFFFNPAVLWISSLIKIERENCCDDIAIAQTRSRRSYINALVSFQEYHLGTNSYAPALTGKKDHLLQRVKRMLYNNNKTLNAMEKTFLMMCLIITTSLSVIFSQAQSGKTKRVADRTVINDSIPSLKDRHFDPKQIKEGTTATYTEKINGVSHTLYVSKRNGVLYEIYDDVAGFKINGKAIPQEQWGQYKDLMNEIKTDQVQADEIPEPDPVEAAKPVSDPDKPGSLTIQNTITYFVNGYRVVTENEEIKEVYLDKDGSRLPESFIEKNKQLLLDGIKKQKADSKREAQQKLSDLDALNAETKRKLADLNEEKEELNRNKTNFNRDIRAEEDKSRNVSVKKADDNKSTHTITGIIYNVSDKPSYNNVYKDYVPSYNRNGQRFDADKLAEDFIADLIRENVIHSKEGLSYKMSSEELIVNGKAQPGALHKKLKDKYLKDPGLQMVCNWRM